MPAPSSSWSRPRRGEHFFIECNPRIQVEHTVTEQVMGVDLVEAQFRIAAGGTLTALGLADQAAVGAPRGFAVQARVVAQGAGTLTAYKEPAGAGVRVDACGYVGLRAAAAVRSAAGQGDLLSRARRAPSPRRVERTARALDEFHIAGLPDQPRPAPRHPAPTPSSVPAMRARRCWPSDPAAGAQPARRQRSRGPVRSSTSRPPRLRPRRRRPAAPPRAGVPRRRPRPCMAVESPHAPDAVVDIKVRRGRRVAAGDHAVRASAP